MLKMLCTFFSQAILSKNTKTPSFFLSSTGKRKDVHVLCEQEGTLRKWSLQEFEKQMEVEYLFRLEFASRKILHKVMRACKKAKECGNISPKEIWLGSLFEKEIQGGDVGDVFLRWTGPQSGYGLFAARDLPKGYYVGEYVGRVRRFSERKDRRNCYCFEYKSDLHSKTPYTIDAQDKGNLTRFINHRSSCNLTPRLVFCQDVQHIILLANQPIAKGSELTYDYGPTYWSKREMPLSCMEEGGDM